MLIQGPSFPFRKSRSSFKPWIFGDAIDGVRRVTPARIDAWIRTGISIQGRPECIFVKTHTHGAAQAGAVLGEEMDEIFTYLEQRYNDGDNWILHYVTAREMYNICKALEAGEPMGDPSRYRDYRVAPPTYDSTPDVLEASESLKSRVSRTYSG